MSSLFFQILIIFQITTSKCTTNQSHQAFPSYVSNPAHLFASIIQNSIPTPCKPFPVENVINLAFCHRPTRYVAEKGHVTWQPSSFRLWAKSHRLGCLRLHYYLFYTYFQINLKWYYSLADNPTLYKMCTFSTEFLWARLNLLWPKGN